MDPKPSMTCSAHGEPAPSTEPAIPGSAFTTLAANTSTCDTNIASRPITTRMAPNLTDYQTVFTNAKAGMEGVDKEHVKRVVWEMSQGSAHFKNEQRKQAATDDKIKRLKAQAQALTTAELAHHTHEMDKKLVMLEATRDLSRTWIHVDMDAFYAACEEQVNPALKSVPMAVGGIGMITTANYPARKFGVRAAMPGFIAKKLCPHLVFVSSNFERYTAASERTRAVFARYDAGFEAGSLDEAHLDVTGYCTQHGVTGAEAAAALRREVEAETGGLTCSCGVAPNKMLAKVCSDINKPNGQFILGSTREEVAAFVATLPVRKIPGVGKVTEQTLAALGVTLCRDLYDHRGLLAALFQPASIEFFMESALGLGATRHAPRAGPNDVGRKGISHERTFKPMSAWPELEAQIEALVHSVVEDMDSEGIQGNNITLKLKTTGFKVTTHSRTLPAHAHTVDQLLPAATQLLRAQLPCELRLMGIRMAGLRKRPSSAGSGTAPAPGTLAWFLRPAGGAGGSTGGLTPDASSLALTGQDAATDGMVDCNTAAVAVSFGQTTAGMAGSIGALSCPTTPTGACVIGTVACHSAPDNIRHSERWADRMLLDSVRASGLAEDVWEDSPCASPMAAAWAGFDGDRVLERETMLLVPVLSGGGAQLPAQPPSLQQQPVQQQQQLCQQQHQQCQQQHQQCQQQQPQQYKQQPQLQQHEQHPTQLQQQQQQQPSRQQQQGQQQYEQHQPTIHPPCPRETPSIQPAPAMQPQPKRPRLGGVPAGTSQHGSAGSWVCGVCTYASNHSSLLRCNMCDAWRGSTSHQQSDSGSRDQNVQGTNSQVACAGSKAGTHGVTTSTDACSSGRGNPALLLGKGGSGVAAGKARDNRAVSGRGATLQKPRVGMVSRPDGQARPAEKARSKVKARPEGVSGLQPCGECGQLVPAAEWQEHQDLHIAVRRSLQDAAG